MAVTALQHELELYSDWRDELLSAIEAYKVWLDEEHLLDATGELRLLELIEGLRKDHVKIALVAEFSRGKTELINSIFFAEHQRRLLPSSVGRTTMCPTEILYEEDEPPYLRLLPIETRKSSLSIEEYKDAPVNWTHIDLDIDDPEQMAAALAQLVRTSEVSEQEAKQLGFPPHCLENPKHGLFKIPQWRHAVINYPHPILKNGLVILDTPGLNALGTEPELTLNMLPSAHSVLFVLAADTGVTRSDMDTWRNHVIVAVNPRKQSAMAVLNKIDTLWDDLHDDDTITQRNIQRQIQETAHILDIDEHMVIPVSAQKGLIAKVRNDPMLLRRSGLPRLEKILAHDLTSIKQKLIQNKVRTELGTMVDNSLEMYLSRLDALKKEHAEIARLRGKSKEVLANLGAELKEQKDKLDQAYGDYHKSRQIISDQSRRIRSRLSSKNVDHMIDMAREAMRESWNTIGLKRGMSSFFDQALERMNEVEQGTMELQREVERVYERFRSRHGLILDSAPPFEIEPFTTDFEKLHNDGIRFRDSLLLVMTEQHYVIKRFFISLASRAKRIMDETNYALHGWSKELLVPIKTQIRERKRDVKNRLSNIEQIQTSHDDLELHIAQIESQITILHNQVSTLKRILRRIEA